MRKPKPMNKISLIIREKDLDTVVHLLYDLQLVQFFETQHQKLNSISQKELDDESKEIIELRTAITTLKPYFTEMSGAYSKDAIDLTHELKAKERTLYQQLIQAKDSQTRDKVKQGLRITSINLKSGIVGYIESSKQSQLDDFKKENRRVKSFKLQERIYFYSPEEPNFSYKEYFIPQELTKTPIKDLETEYQYIVNQLQILANANLRHLQAQELKLSKTIEVEQSKENFKQSKHHIAIQGYIPSEELHRLEIAMQSELADKFSIEIESAGDDAPVLLPNKGVGKSFESLLSMYALPKYKEIDPTTLMMLFFPIFYGFILGDFGYGLMTFIVFSLVKSKFKQFKEFISVMQLSSVSSMAFGIWYGEYLGFEPKIFAWEFHRSHDPNTLLIIALIFGLIHINIGFIIGILNHINNFKRIMTDYVSWFILQAAVVCFYMATITTGIYDYIGALLFVSAAILLYKGHGIGGVIEIPSLFTNIFSYARLMAVGTSSVVIAVLINTFSVPLIQAGPVSAVFGITLFTVGHIFNIILGNFESFLHSLRLHYVEFFTKFYEGGGDEFKPFGKKISNK